MHMSQSHRDMSYDTSTLNGQQIINLTLKTKVIVDWIIHELI